MIGALSSGETLQILSTEPLGIITGSIYGYTPGESYYQADSLNRGNGYWVKVNQNGIIFFISYTDCGTVNYSGKIYQTVQIGDQCWLKENLDVGVMLPDTLDATDNGVIEKYCFDNDPNNCVVYGGLYQWDEIMQYSTTEGTQGICQPGWHIPTLTEIQTLSTVVGGDGNALKAIGQGIGGGAGTNTSGFSASLAGWYYNFGGIFTNLGFAYIWSSTESSPGSVNAYVLFLRDDDSIIRFNQYNQLNGICVRCLKD